MNIRAGGDSNPQKICTPHCARIAFYSVIDPLPEALSLIFDADDTLWHSNVHFLEAEREFLAAIGRLGIDVRPAEVRSAVRHCELEIIKSHGYGRGPYVKALHNAAVELAPEPLQPALGVEIERLGQRLLERECDLLPGVEQTLAELARRHTLMLFTKGQPAEQMAKVSRSGLAPFFSRVEIPSEKDVAAYRLLVEQAGLDPARSYMIGNSPRSDINPALKAGLGAVYIPYPDTWELEHEELSHGHERLTVVAEFASLLDLF